MDRRQIIATKATLQVLSHIAKIIYYAGSLALLTGSMQTWRKLNNDKSTQP